VASSDAFERDEVLAGDALADDFAPAPVDDSDVSAEATAVPLRIAAPTPRVNASPPTRPT